MAEKVETILSRGIFTTRPRDFYDIYILGTTQSFDKLTFYKALEATAEHRGSKEKLSEKEAIITLIAGSSDLQQIWKKYQRKFSYARDITFEDIVNVLRILME